MLLILIAALTTSLLHGVTENPNLPSSVKEQANVQLANGIPFMSDADLHAALSKAGVSPRLRRRRRKQTIRLASTGFAPP